MNRLLLLLVLMGIGQASFTQYIYKIKADSVLITNSCDTAELIIENHTQTVPGFLYNKGRGRTEFRRVLQGINDTLVMIGPDTLRLPNAWVQGGNRWNTTGVFGTTDNNPIDFYTNSIQRARLMNNGHLLIGTTNDGDGYGGAGDNKLQVNGSATITGQATDVLSVPGTIIQGAHQETQLGNGLVFREMGNRAGIYSDQRTIQYQSNYTGDQHRFENGIGTQFTGTLVTIYPGGDPLMPDNQLSLKVYGKLSTPGLSVNMLGNVGIGNLAPSAKLHVSGTVRFEELTNNNSLTHVVVADAYGNLFYKDVPSAFNGTMNSDLAVNGSVSAQKMLISQTGRWPDYVFNKQYQLPSLTEVESFINQNSHLPGIPSAVEVAKKGIDVAGNQAVLLKKIEELTLYAIDQDKKLQKQSEAIAELKNKNKELETLKKQMAELKALIINASQSVK